MTFRYRLLGSSSLRVSPLCLGTMTFGGDHAGSAVEDAEADRILGEFYDAGGNFIDTANRYSYGRSEALLGRIIGNRRRKTVLATKYTLCMDDADPNTGGGHRKNLHDSLTESLRRLRSDYVDLLWVHAWDRHTPTVEIMRALDDQVRAGRVLHIGASNIPAWRIAEANTLARSMGWTPFTAVQIQYSLVERTLEHELTPMCEALDLAITAWSPLAGGLLTGKYLDPDFSEGRLKTTGYGNLFLSERNLDISRRTQALADELGVKSGQVALAWLCAHGAIPIVGGTRPEHFSEAWGAAELRLTEDQVAALDAISTPPPTQPSMLYPRIDGMLYGEAGLRVDSR